MQILSFAKTAQTTSAGVDYAARSLRFVLMIGFGGMAVVFLLATIDAVHLLGAMRAENKLLRDAALERNNHLASIRTSILLTHTYLETISWIRTSKVRRPTWRKSGMRGPVHRPIWRTIGPAPWMSRFK